MIWDKETEYQYARVVQEPSGERRLELNEGQAIHSLYRPGEWLTGGYWDEMLVLPFAARARPPRCRQDAAARDGPPERSTREASAAGWRGWCGWW